MHAAASVRRMIPVPVVRSCVLVLVAGVALGVAGCSDPTEAMDLAANEPPAIEPAEVAEPTDQEVAQAQAEVEEDIPGWVCSYDPTMNHDWHDDVVCESGGAVDRPYLREWDDFVTEEELMQSAAEYEAELNAAG